MDYIIDYMPMNQPRLGRSNWQYWKAGGKIDSVGLINFLLRGLVGLVGLGRLGVLQISKLLHLLLVALLRLL